MKNLIQYILAGWMLVLITSSCCNDFLNEKPDISSSGESTIIISPTWEAKDYSIYCPNVNNAKFTVIQSPAWLNISSITGQFKDGIASLHCSAVVNSEFSKTGVYSSHIVVSVENKGNYTIPIIYVTEGNPAIETNKSLTINYNNYNSNETSLKIKNTGEGILVWEIKEWPKWMKFNTNYQPNNVIPQGAVENIYLTYNPDVPLTEETNGKIVLWTNDKNNPEVIVNVNYNLGNPELHCYSNKLDFGRTATTQNFEFSNQSYSSLLVWKIENCPEWLTVSKPSGYLADYSYERLTFTCDRNKMPAGLNQVTIYLKTNDKASPVYEIPVTARNGNGNNVQSVQGSITDAWLDKQTDILYYITAQPNKLIAYDIQSKTVSRELSLSKAPTCFSISEDGRKALVGHNGLISYVNMDNFTVNKTIEVNQVVNDIEWVNDNWSCYTDNNDQWTNLRWVNLNTNIVESGANIYKGCVLHRMPGKNYIVVSEINLSGGIYIFDINSRQKVYEFYTSIGNFWFSENGAYLFSNGNIYRTSSFLTDDRYNVSPIANFAPQPYGIAWIDHNPKTHSIWVLASSDYYYGTERVVVQYEDNDYTRVKDWYYDDFYNNVQVQAQYVFTNGAGNELTVIRNTLNGNSWSLEFIPVTE